MRWLDGITDSMDMSLSIQAWAQSTCPELSAQGLVPLRWGCPGADDMGGPSRSCNPRERNWEPLPIPPMSRPLPRAARAQWGEVGEGEAVCGVSVTCPGGVA